MREGNTHSERPPHLEVGPFRLWVHGRERPDCDDAWDGNWLYVTARCGGVSVRGPVLETVAVARLRRELARLQETLSGEAVLDSLEPQLSLRLEASDRLGHIAVRIEITPDHLSEGHWFAYGSTSRTCRRCCASATPSSPSIPCVMPRLVVSNKRIELARSTLHGELRSVSARSSCARR